MLTKESGVQIVTRSVVLSAAICGYALLALSACKKSGLRRPWSAFETHAAGIAMTSNGARDMFALVPSAVDGAFTSQGDTSCDLERREPVRFVLRTDGGFRTCSGQFLEAVEPWATRQDVIAVICGREDQAIVLADGTYWARKNPAVPFRALKDCRMDWHGRIGGCRDLSQDELLMPAPPDICKFNDDGG